MNGYELSRTWFDFCFDNPEKVKPIHSAIYFFAIEHCNRLGWKQKFGFPSQMVMEAIGVKNWRTYSKALNEVVNFGFIEMIEISKNQYSSNIIAIVKNTKAHTKAQSKALDKALSKHSTKHSQSTVSINKQYNKEQLNKEQGTKEEIDFDEVLNYFNNTCTGLPKIRSITKKRKSAILARAKEYSFEEIGNVFTIASKSSFLNGSSQNGWTADFDWILKPSNFIKILEGNYNDKEKQVSSSKKDAAQMLFEKYTMKNN